MEIGAPMKLGVYIGIRVLMNNSELFSGEWNTKEKWNTSGICSTSTERKAKIDLETHL